MREMREMVYKPWVLIGKMWVAVGRVRVLMWKKLEVVRKVSEVFR